MAFINPNHRGLAYGDGYLQGDGQLGQVVRIVGNDLFAVNTTPTAKSFGILIRITRTERCPASTAWAASTRPTSSRGP